MFHNRRERALRNTIKLK
uniref:Uncharacterized protein n=1 Tax=Rhizophora mucronata TaxID=61149 RepID=A0A2P2N6R9_RHIMU